MRMDDIVAQCPGVLAIHDDVFIYGKDNRDHNANIINLFNVAQKEGLVFNSKKCAIKQESVTFFGGVFSTEGYSPDLEKIQGISKMTLPQMKQELQSFLGAVNYLQTFIPHLSLNTEPLRALLKKENCFAWDENTNTCFQKIKSQLQKALLRPLRYYDQTNRSPSSVMLHSRGWEPASFKMDSPSHLPANPSWTPRPATPTLRENSWPSYMVVRNSIHICMEGHSSWKQTTSPSR